MKQQNILKLHNFDDMKTTYRVFWSIYEDGVFGEYGEYTNKSEAIKAAHDNSFNIAGTQPHCNYIWRVKNNKTCFNYRDASKLMYNCIFVIS